MHDPGPPQRINFNQQSGVRPGTCTCNTPSDSDAAGWWASGQPHKVGTQKPQGSFLEENSDEFGFGPTKLKVPVGVSQGEGLGAADSCARAQKRSPMQTKDPESNPESSANPTAREKEGEGREEGDIASSDGGNEGTWICWARSSGPGDPRNKLETRRPGVEEWPQGEPRAAGGATSQICTLRPKDGSSQLAPTLGR